MKTGKNFKVLMIAPTPFFSDRGCHVRILEEAIALEKSGFEVLITTYHLGYNPMNSNIHRIIPIPWYQKVEAGPSFHKLYLDFLLFIKTFFIYCRFKPNIIHAHLHEGAFIGIMLSHLISKWRPCPVILDCQGSLTDEMLAHNFFTKKSRLYSMFQHIEKYIYKKSDAIITSSPRTSDSENLFIKTCRESHKVYELLDWVDTNRFSPSRKNDQPSLEKWGIPPNRIVGVFLGLLEPYQGIDLLLQAIKLVIPEKKNIQFLIIGFPKVNQYKKQADRLGISDWTTFTGRIAYADIPLYLGRAHFSIAPKYSLSEANGKIFNFMAMGLPVIAFDTQLNRSILGEYGIYADFKDSQSLASKILDIATDAEKRIKLKKELLNLCQTKYSQRGKGKALEKIYQKVLKQ